MDSIVLRDRNGKEINYHGIDYLNVKTPDGETQGYAAYDPETLVPENLVSGVKVGDVEGALEVPQAVETTIDPDFSAGDMEVVPEDGQVFSKVSIPTPSNLVPANIAKDVDIAGVVGTLESSGGSADNACLFSLCALSIEYKSYPSAAGTLTATAIANVYPATAEIVHASAFSDYTSKSSSSNFSSGNGGSVVTPTVTQYASYKKVQATKSRSYSSRYYTMVFCVMDVDYTIPGCTLQDREEGLTFVADSSVAGTITFLPVRGKDIAVVDFSASQVTDLYATILTPKYEQLERFIFPPTITTVQSTMFQLNGSAKQVTLDFSGAATIPTLSGSYLTTDKFPGGLQILVPTTLYDQWIVTTNWSALADYIVAV